MIHLSSPEAARQLGLRPHTLRVWRMQGKGPKYLRLGGPRARCVYSVEELAKWTGEHTFSSTSQETVAHANEAR